MLWDNGVAKHIPGNGSHTDQLFQPENQHLLPEIFIERKTTKYSTKRPMLY